MGKNNRKRPDHWSQRAKDEGYAARSVYKLIEIERRAQVFRKTKRIIDLGCAPDLGLRMHGNCAQMPRSLVSTSKRLSITQALSFTSPFSIPHQAHSLTL